MKRFYEVWMKYSSAHPRSDNSKFLWFLHKTYNSYEEASTEVQRLDLIANHAPLPTLPPPWYWYNYEIEIRIKK